jgi:YidC/Oxa1 family membrane protein insertase
MGGSVGAGIFAFSVIVRIALLPMTLRAARQMRDQQAKMKELKPALERIRKRHASDKVAEQQATIALYRDNGVSAVPAGLLGTAVQMPIGMALYQAIRGSANGGSFLWIRDLARPDVALALAAAGVTALAARFGGTDNPRAAMLVGATITFVIAWRLSAGVALYSIAWSGVSAGEAWLVRRSIRPSI